MPYSTKEKAVAHKEHRKSISELRIHDKLYNVWRGVKKRCLNPNHYAYDLYGQRGITICSEWMKFECFYKWALENGYEEGLTLDRIDVNGNYEPSNCRWTTWKEQGNNRRTNTLITFNGKTQTLTQWANEIGVTTQCLHRRLNKSHMPLHIALNAKLNEYNRWTKEDKKWQAH